MRETQGVQRATGPQGAHGHGHAPPLLMGCKDCLCWEGAGAAYRTAGGACNFTRNYVPRLPEQCVAPDD